MGSGKRFCTKEAAELKKKEGENGEGNQSGRTTSWREGMVEILQERNESKAS